MKTFLLILLVLVIGAVLLYMERHDIDDGLFSLEHATETPILTFIIGLLLYAVLTGLLFSI